MLQLGALAFLNPALLAALVALPALWWLLRITPPSPKLIRFPAVRLLFGLAQSEETPARTPLWLVLLRLLLAALIIIGLAQPLLNPVGPQTGSGPLVVAIDNGWAAARNWSARQSMLASLLESAERQSRPVVLLPTAPPANGDKLQASGLLAAADAMRLAQALKPLPWPTDRKAALAALDGLKLPSLAHVVWLSDGIAEGDAAAFAKGLQRLGPVRVVGDAIGSLPHLLLPPSTQGAQLGLTAVRATSGGSETVTVRALDDRGHPAGEVSLAFEPGKRLALGTLALPVELRNQVARLEIAGERSAAATVLLDDRWRRRPVGLVTGGGNEQGEPLLGGQYYLERALQPYSEVVEGGLEQLLQRQLAVLVLTDREALTAPQRGRLDRWIRAGGTLLRFAGPRLAQGNDDLVPVKLRRGERELGGAMSWEKPEPLAAFDDKSPFSGLAVPADVLIKRQVLAEPSLDLDSKTWARLADGTPLVTAEKRGQGWLVLVHTTASPDWSNLPLSGLFVEMLQRIVAASQGVVGTKAQASLPPFKSLDGFGELTSPLPAASALTPEDLAHPHLGPRHPPGYYGSQASRRALNLTNEVIQVFPLGPLPAGVERSFYSGTRERDLKPWLLGAAMLLALIDLLVSLGLRGLLIGRRLRPVAGKAAALLLFAAALCGGLPAHAATATTDADDSTAIAATTSTRLAYVVTGDRQLDDISKAGLTGLTFALNARTAVEAASPMAVDPDKDELAFFPLLYWPIPDEMPALSAHAIEKLVEYLHNGGQILFDARDPNRSAPSWIVLRQILEQLDLPALVPVPEDHVLTRSFYLLRDFPGRFDGSTVWVERPDDNVNDGVSAVVIGGNDWAGAWAVDETGQPLEAVTPGGERQREMALRFGINLVMYALTGNYKSDQVHLPAILERLGL
ncbi:MAG TPA: DUF4159 domain-containing protein [Alphaproteobacteria bacterium]|nr:DUF4159 domain-containing protein [Alphaproteobacteria bacterium]